MKVAVFKKAGWPLQIEDVPDPTPSRGQVVIKIHRCGICGTDLHMTSGHGVNFAPGTIPGHEMTGEVVALGSRVTRFKVGDYVVPHAFGGGCGGCAACLGGEPHWCTSGGDPSVAGFGQYTRINEMAALKLPAGITPVDGALIEPLACSLHGLRVAGTEKGKRVLIIGAGPIGLGAVYWSRLMGANTVVVMARSDRRKPVAMQIGTDAFLIGPRDDSGRAVTEALGGPPDIVVECAGTPGVLNSAIQLVRPKGTVMSLGMCLLPDTYDGFTCVMKEVTVKFSLLYSLAEYQMVIDAYEAGHMEPRHMISNTITLGMLPDRFEAMREPNDYCKVLVDPWLETVS
jgi:(R,R)-butanediol dehydrogenase/meso-butanediol dehydrogenase/diacetyl reductase